MHKMIPVKNNTKAAIFVGGAMIAPGETRHFPEHQVPAHLRPAAKKEEPEPAVDAVLALLDGNVKAVAEALPGLSDDDLARLKAAEENGKTRQGVMKAIAEEELVRAQQAAKELTTGEDEGQGGENLDGQEG